LKICANCAASNVNSSEFCSECGLALNKLTARGSAPTNAPQRKRRIKLPNRTRPIGARDEARSELDSRRLADTLEMSASRWPTKRRRADIMFILDCTESMGGEIDAIRDAMISFVEMLQRDGLDIRVGLVEFRDRLVDEEQRALQFDGQPFTSDPTIFRREAMALQSVGGGDAPESSLDAVLLALRQPFDPQAQKILVLVTDAPPHVPDKEARSVEQVVAAVRAAMISQFYLIIPVQEAQNQVYLHLCSGTRGIAFDLGKGADFRQRAEDFKRTLLSLGKTISAATV
jgi:Mg-chelatase subunit ChlD